MAEKETKKRKRVERETIEANKRAAIGETGSERITVHLNNESGLQPVLLSTPGLTAPTVSFNAYSKTTSTGTAGEARSKPSNPELLLQSAEHPRLDYVASQELSDQTSDHYIAIFDPSTKELQLTPVTHLSLKCTLRAERRNEPEKRQRTIGQQREDLGRHFGTKKARKVISDRIVNAIVQGTPDKGKNDAQTAILDSMADSALPTLNEQEEAEAALASKPIPKPNIAAENVEDVYPFQTLIPPADAHLITIKDWQEKAKAHVGIDFSHEYPARRVEALGQTDQYLRLKALRYLTLVLEFHNVLISAGRNGKKVPQKRTMQEKFSAWPEPLVDSVRRRFANAQNELPKWHMDNLYTHICALALYVDGWTMDITHLKSDLKMENREIMRYFRELGCKIGPPTEGEKASLNLWWARDLHRAMTKEVAAATRVAKLKLPLDFPKARSGRTR